MAMKQFRFNFTMSDGTVLPAVTEPLELMVEDTNQQYSGTTYTVEDLVLDGTFGATTGLKFTLPYDDERRALLNKLLTMNMLFANPEDITETYVSNYSSTFINGLSRAGYVSKLSDSATHLFVDVQLWHTWDLQKTGTTDRYRISAGPISTTVFDLGYAAPLRQTEASVNYKTQYLTERYTRNLVLRLLNQVTVVPTEPQLEGLDWENSWKQTGGVSDSPTGARLLTHSKVTFLATPY